MPVLVSEKTSSQKLKAQVRCSFIAVRASAGRTFMTLLIRVRFLVLSHPHGGFDGGSASD